MVMTHLVINRAEQLGSASAKQRENATNGQNNGKHDKKGKVTKTLINGEESEVEKWILQHNFVLMSHSASTWP
jgi:hypothetical protein